MGKHDFEFIRCKGIFLCFLPLSGEVTGGKTHENIEYLNTECPEISHFYANPHSTAKSSILPFNSSYYFMDSMTSALGE